MLAIIAIAKDQVKGGMQLLLASIFMLPIIFALSLFFWALIVGAFIVSSAKAHSTTSAQLTPSATAQLASKQTPMSLDSKRKILDQIRHQNLASMANFGTTDQDIDIQIQSDSSFDAAKAKKAALVVAKGWHDLSGQPKVFVSIRKDADLMAKESFS